MTGPPRPVRPKVPNAVLAFVLGIVGVAACSVCAPFAWYFGRRADEAVDASGGTLDGRSYATAGKILGIVGTVFLVLTVVGLIVWVAVVASTT
jgi:Domain of unknown function (DUF4190)